MLCTVVCHTSDCQGRRVKPGWSEVSPPWVGYGSSWGSDRGLVGPVIWNSLKQERAHICHLECMTQTPALKQRKGNKSPGWAAQSTHSPHWAIFMSSCTHILQPERVEVFALWVWIITTALEAGPALFTNTWKLPVLDRVTKVPITTWTIHFFIKTNYGRTVLLTWIA